MDYILMFMVGFWLGTFYITFRLRHLLKTLTDVSGIDQTEQENLKKSDIPVLITEQHGDMLYLFDKDSDTFMVQGKTLEDLQQKLSEYKNIHIAMVVHNTNTICFVNGEIVKVDMT